MSTSICRGQTLVGQRSDHLGLELQAVLSHLISELVLRTEPVSSGRRVEHKKSIALLSTTEPSL